MTELTTRFAAYAAAIRHGDLPPAVEARTRFLILDLVGNMLRGRHDAESSTPLLAAARAMGLAHGRHAVFGEAGRWSPLGAALLNGAFAHSLDFDDTHAAGTLHPGAPVIPAALAAAEMCGAAEPDVLAAIVAGYEVTNRLALALPGGEATRGLVGRDVIAALGPEGVLVNVGRGTVVDEGTLIEALAGGGLGAAGLDVFASEPDVDPRLLALPNVVLTPHAGSATVETRAAMSALVVDALDAFFAGRPLPATLPPP